MLLQKEQQKKERQFFIDGINLYGTEDEKEALEAYLIQQDVVKRMEEYYETLRRGHARVSEFLVTGGKRFKAINLAEMKEKYDELLEEHRAKEERLKKKFEAILFATDTEREADIKLLQHAYKSL
ncbi:hypothetical protein [Ammoniphilus sp. CFH 90114]|uniref:hypothetical protein n=1 Tax=Ammoniphilus sp. CFH 90114 TaxID=2493665 RepID=UPI00100EA777|nr:hypothetical protein [Ammoniphilus sp. CFH 90114]RXT08056.1 hypothetical protein EIZ39_11640 [Ammoniphilus sp. CFH 90114]